MKPDAVGSAARQCALFRRAVVKVFRNPAGIGKAHWPHIFLAGFKHYRGREDSMDDKGLKSGEKAPRSGQYEIIGPRGGHTGEERTIPKGHTVPPTPKPDQTLKIVDPTKNKSGKP
jgi:hypothetical protein